MRKRRQKANPVIPWTREQILNKPNLVVPALLTSSYIYYCREELREIMADEDFDWAAKFMLKNYRNIQHMHKHLIKRSHLRAGTLFDLREAHYPTICKVTAVGLSMGDLYLQAAAIKSNPVKRKTRKRRTVQTRKRRERPATKRSGFLTK